MRLRAAIMTFFFCWASQQISAEIPIIAFCGVPAHESTAERFKEFREAGFDVSIEHYWDMQPQQLRNILDIAHNESVRIMLKSRLLTEHPEQVVPYIKGHPLPTVNTCIAPPANLLQSGLRSTGYPIFHLLDPKAQ